MNTVVGSVSCAVPPLISRSAIGGNLHIIGWVFLLLRIYFIEGISCFAVCRIVLTNGKITSMKEGFE